jgi:hypothetical protein
MRIKALLAVLLGTMLISTGCTGMRNRERSLRDPVQLPAAPKLDQGLGGATPPSMGGATGASGANMSGPSVSPLSSTAPAGAGVLR